MAVRYDISIVDDDLAISGDFLIAESDQQHIIDTINAFPGWWKQYPNEGVGIKAWIKSPAIIQQMTKVIKLNLQADNYTCSPKIGFDALGNLQINPNVTI